MSAAPTAPIRLTTGVPNAIADSSATYPAGCRLSMTPSNGATTSSGTPVVSQCAAVLASTVTQSGTGSSASSSRLPSS